MKVQDVKRYWEMKGCFVYLRRKMEDWLYDVKVDKLKAPRYVQWVTTAAQVCLEVSICSDVDFVTTVKDQYDCCNWSYTKVVSWTEIKPCSGSPECRSCELSPLCFNFRNATLKWCYKIVFSVSFEYFIYLLILLNIFPLILEFIPEISNLYAPELTALNYIFFSCYLLEAILKVCEDTQ